MSSVITCLAFLH